MTRDEVASELGIPVEEVAAIEAAALAKMRVALADFDDNVPATRPPPAIKNVVRAMRAQRGICTWCRKAPARPDRRMCGPCGAKATDSSRRSRLKHGRGPASSRRAA